VGFYVVTSRFLSCYLAGMEQIEIARTILRALPHIDKRINAEQNYARRLAINSWNGYEDTLTLMERIIDKTYKSWQLHNLKIRCDRIIGYAPKKIQRVIEVFFMQKNSYSETARKMKISLRTVERLVEEAVEYFATSIPCTSTYRGIRSILT